MAGPGLAGVGLDAEATAAAGAAFGAGAAVSAGAAGGAGTTVRVGATVGAAEAVGAGAAVFTGARLGAAGAGADGALATTTGFAGGWASRVNFGTALLAAATGATTLFAGAALMPFAALGAETGAAAVDLLIWFGFSVFLFDFI